MAAAVEEDMREFNGRDPQWCPDPCFAARSFKLLDEIEREQKGASPAGISIGTCPATL
jgi:hypothetical protein